MADFPSKVTTETSVHQSQSSSSARMASISIDTSFIRSIPAILMIVEILFGLIQWALIVSTPYRVAAPYIWVLLVAIGFWITTIILFVLLLFGIREKLTFVSWPLTEMIYNGVVTVVYFIGFVVNAVYTNAFLYHGHLAAAAAFGALVTVAYGVSTVFAFLSWKGGQGNTGPGTVPT